MQQAILALLFICFSVAGAQEAEQASATPTVSITASLNKSLNMYVFPAKDQSAGQQGQDESACYQWAAQQSGVDPLNMTATKPDSVAAGPDGSAVRGAARGAVAGVAIGAIAGDAGKGAAIGAAAGGMAGVRGKRIHDAKKEQQAEAEAHAQDEAKIDSFKKAYSACLEGKGYSVK